MGAQIALLLGNITLIVFITYTYFQNRKNIQEFSAIRFHIFGIAFLFFSALFEYLRFALTNKDTSDRAASLRFSILLFIIIFSVGSHIQTSKLMENGLKYKIVRNLAYSDGLTNLGNRTAFLEQLDNYSKSKLTSLGIVFLDVNNLKVINDQKGHEVGDYLLKTASDIIQNSFDKFGKSYRIGGDEFCVLIENDHLQSVYESALQEFEQLIADANQDNPLGVEIYIAHGFCICTEMTREKIDEVINQADCKM